MLNIVFMGTPDFSAKSLEKIYEKGYNIIGVVTAPDKPKGRGMKLVYSPVKEFALNNNIQLFQPEKVRNNIEFIEEIKSLSPDIICVVSYGKILPQDILDIPKKGCINVHPSLLPKYRGAAPIFWTILNGDKITGVTTMYMDAGMDTGDMILQEKVKVADDVTSGELWDRLATLGSTLLVQTLEKVEQDIAPRTKQGEDYTIAPMLNKEMAYIDWNNKSAQEIHNLIRGLNPVMGAYSYIDGKKVKLWKTEIIKEKLDNISTEKLDPGTIIISDEKQGLYIKANDGILKVLEMQAENAKKMSAQEFIRGNKIECGTKLL